VDCEELGRHTGEILWQRSHRGGVPAASGDNKTPDSVMFDNCQRCHRTSSFVAYFAAVEVTRDCFEGLEHELAQADEHKVDRERDRYLQKRYL
jgi:hypothetical protein